VSAATSVSKSTLLPSCRMERGSESTLSLPGRPALGRGVEMWDSWLVRIRRPSSNPTSLKERLKSISRRLNPGVLTFAMLPSRTLCLRLVRPRAACKRSACGPNSPFSISNVGPLLGVAVLGCLSGAILAPVAESDSAQLDGRRMSKFLEVGKFCPNEPGV
jgi:hypothetical protein